MIRIKFANKARYAREVEQFIGRMKVAASKVLREIGEEVIKDANDVLESQLMIGASPPQFLRKGDPRWIHKPIKDSWSEPKVEIRGEVARLRVENTSQHAAAVEFGTIQVEPIRPKEKPYLVFDSLYWGLIRAPEVQGQMPKAFLYQTLTLWNRKLPIEFRKRMGAYL